MVFFNNTGDPTGQEDIGLLNSTDWVNWQLVNYSILDLGFYENYVYAGRQ